MIVRVTLKDRVTDKPFTMLFGDSYKKWQDQFTEFMFRYYTPKGEGWRYSAGHVKGKIISCDYSRHQWKSWGGLKWCREKMFQQELNREGVQQDEPDCSNPRQYEDIKRSFRYMDRERLLRPLRRY